MCTYKPKKQHCYLFTLVRLVNGTIPLEGTVQVYHEGAWGTICDDSWDYADARVVCRQLGYSGGDALVDLEYGVGTGYIMMDEVACDGTETRLVDCDRRSWYHHDCGHNEDAGVHCSN